MRNLSELNINEGREAVKRPAPSMMLVAEFERTHGIRLPSAYIQLLGHANGGHPELDSFVLPEDGQRWSLNYFFSLEGDRNKVGGLWTATQVWQKILGDKAIPLGSDGGGNVLFLDYGTTPPSVKLCVHDEAFKILHVSRSFEEFIDGLSENPDMT